MPYFNPHLNIKGVVIHDLQYDRFDLLEQNSYFRYVLQISESFSKILNIDDLSLLLSKYGHIAYNYKNYWESQGLKFEQCILIFLLSKIKPYSLTVGDINGTWIDEKDWVKDMLNKDFVKSAIATAEQNN